jgi:hypothetical protein
VPTQDDRGRLHEHAGVEGHVVGDPVHDPLGHRDERGIATRPGEAERLDSLAPLGLAGPAARTAVASDEALADDAIALAQRIDARSHPDNGARPLVAGDDRVPHPPRVGEGAGHHLDVGAA